MKFHVEQTKINFVMGITFRGVQESGREAKRRGEREETEQECACVFVWKVRGRKKKGEGER